MKSNPHADRIAARVRDWIAGSHTTLPDLAARTGLTPATVQKIANGDGAGLTADQFARLVLALKMPKHIVFATLFQGLELPA